jgi:hypothetical protein
VQLCDRRAQNQGLGAIDLGIKVSGFIEYPNRIKPNYRGNPGSSNKQLLARRTAADSTVVGQGGATTLAAFCYSL